MTVRAMVINIHLHGATVRLHDGRLAAVPAGEFAAHRAAYVAGYDRREDLDLVLVTGGRHPTVGFGSPTLASDAFEERVTEYLRSRLDWTANDGPDAADRHFIRKKRRAALFEARTAGL